MTLSTPKVTIIGAGNVGATAAQKILDRELADVVLLDRNANIASGKALDIGQASALELRNRTVIGTDSYEATNNSNIVVITAGLPRRPGQSRDDLLQANGEIVSSVTEQAVKHSPNCILIVVSNPVDVMTHLAWLKSKLPENKVMGMAGVLDSARMKYFIAQELKVSPKEIETISVLGGHGDEMVPLTRLITVSGEPLSNKLSPAKILEICKRTRNGGGEIVELLGTSSYYGAGSAIADMVQAIIQDEKRVVPIAAYLKGEYGLSNVFVGVPGELGKDGVEKIIIFDLAPEELDALRKSAGLVKENVDKLAELKLV